MIKLNAFYIHDLFGFTLELFTKGSVQIEYPKSNDALTVDFESSPYISVN